MYEICQKVDEKIPYDDFSSQIRYLNNEQQIIVDDILYSKKLKSNKSLAYFLNESCKYKENFYTYVYYSKHGSILYNTNFQC